VDVRGQPAAGSAGCGASRHLADERTTGNLGYVNAVANANTGHFVNAQVSASVVNNTLLLYDRCFLSRGDDDGHQHAISDRDVFALSERRSPRWIRSAGNFLFPSDPTTVLAATRTTGRFVNTPIKRARRHNSIDRGHIGLREVHQWISRLATGSCHWPLATWASRRSLKCNGSASVATGTIDFVVGHPIAAMPCLIANMVMNIDGVASAFNLQQVYDNACLAFLELPKAAASACTYNGIVLTVSE
jgi:hypothetical protein